MAPATTEVATVLVVGHAPELRETLEAVLHSEGFAVTAAPTEAVAADLASTGAHDVVVLDLGASDAANGRAGHGVRAVSDAPIIMLATRCDQVDRLTGVRIGIDDYVTKPVDPAELAARVHAALQRSRGIAAGPTATGPGRVRVGDIEIDTVARAAFVDDHDIDLTATEFRLLGTLAMAPTTTFTRRMLLDHAWADGTIDLDLVDVEIANLRRKVDRNGCGHIRTVRGVGYRLANPD